MAVSFEKKLDLIRKANATLKKEKITTLLGQASNIDSYSTENQTKIKGNVDSLYKQIAEAYAQKKKAVAQANAPVSKARKKPKKEDTMMGYASMVMKRDNITWKQALKKSKDHFADIRTKKQDAEKKALEDFEKKVGAVDFERATKYKTRKGTEGTDIERDKVRPALPSGKRIVRTKGKTTNQYGTYNNKIGKVYYEKRANRMDINQPSKSVYPKLAKGGEVGDSFYRVYIYANGKVGQDSVYASLEPKIFRDINDAIRFAKSIIEENYSEVDKVKIFTNTGNLVQTITNRDSERNVKERHLYKVKIPNNYLGKTAKEVWGLLTPYQRRHFLDDHENGEYSEFVRSDWDELNDRVRNSFEMHVQQGQYAEGGKIGFDALAKKVARSYKGKKVKAKYQDEYGKTYDSKEAMEVGQKVASKVYRKQLARKGKMAKGGSVDDMYVAVGEKDGYWTILSKPSSKEKSQKLLDLTTLPKGEVGKVVSVEDARSHKLVIGREYLKYAKGGEIDKKKYKFEITEYKDKDAVINDDPTLSDYEGTKEKVIDFEYQRMQRGYCVYFNITIVADSNNQAWFYESGDLYDLIDKIENSDDYEDDDYEDDVMKLYGYAKGGEIAESNRNMALNKAKELCHHVDELHNVLKGKKHIEAWVIAKLERASSDLSDVTHYLDGLSEQKTH